MSVSIMKYLPVVALATALAGCGGTDSGERNQNPNPPPEVDNNNTGLVYNGPAAQGAAVQFKQNLWDNLATDDRCGGCHNETRGFTPLIMRRDNINLAYEAAAPYLNLSVPQESELYLKVAGGHNAWNAGAADTILNLIQNMATALAGSDGGGSTTEIVLTAPVSRQVGSTAQFTADAAAVYAATIGALVRNTGSANCVACHSEDSQLRQQPFFASASPETAFTAARTLIDLNNASNSRFIQRMRENHNVWVDPSGTMTPQAYSVQEMTAAVNAFFAQDGAEVVEVDSRLRVSDAVNLLADGVIASGGGRVQSNVIALYQFKEGSGTEAFDTSGVAPELTLNLSPEVRWVGSWGIRIEDNGIATATSTASRKLHDRIKQTGEFSIEAWVIPANVTQEEARIITYSAGQSVRNFSLNQTLYNYDFLTRTDAAADANGRPQLNTPSADEVLQATLQHVVATYHPIDGRRIYVNGELAAQDANGDNAGSINDWDNTYILAVGNEVGSTDWWEGTVRLLAIHNRVLTPEQVVTNFEVGVGQKYYMLFGVSQYVGMEQAYVVFEVEVYDDYAYQFSAPFFISLSDAEPSAPFRIQGIRIGVNGKEVPVGQAYASVDVTVNADNYVPGVGTPLSTNPRSTIIALENGAEEDLFFLTFDHIAGVESVRDPEPTPVVLPPAMVDPQATFGVRLFDEIFNAMSAITAVPAATVHDYYVTNIRRSLPAAPQPAGFLASQQSAITQLALEYCNELIINNAGDARSTVFPSGYGSMASASDFGPFMDRMLINAGSNLQRHPSRAEIEADVSTLLSAMGSATAQQKAVAACTSLLASSAMLMQ